MERTQRVEFGVHLEILADIATNHDAGDVAVWSQTHEVVANVPIQIHWTELFRKFKWQNQTGSGRCDSATDGIIRIVQRELWKHGHGETKALIVIESPLRPKPILGKAVFRISRRVIHTQLCIFKLKLSAVAKTEIYVYVGGVRDRLIVVEKRHIAQVDFPLLISRCTRIVRVVGRSALGQGCRSSTRESS